MIKRKLLGQHFLNSKSIAEFIVKEAEISKSDVVFEIGTGPGVLIPLMCENAQKVISIDTDEKLIKKARLNFSQFDNWKMEVIKNAPQYDLDTNFVKTLVQDYQVNKRVIENDKCQPEFTLTFSEYIDKRISKLRIKNDFEYTDLSTNIKFTSTMSSYFNNLNFKNEKLFGIFNKEIINGNRNGYFNQNMSITFNINQREVKLRDNLLSRMI